ncbi:hypothetical protein BUZ11_07400 [Staphylococcus gallinarum]|nr:hypothetical protein [Staphylococcus gallinarum]PTL06998.1 hypothetical protein BUZ09_09945 [Staphylococcus gallinarum]PTL11787.1 hypothetical protein BUZ15_01810 [Staphylococcus gallinarum]RIL33284.1 hypothetical protein BUY98_07940 [Staphylococcus gallinarum]RIO82537.1 hypothetical protein BUZ11_07400 [Staphylococcus gallinarum]
MGIFQIYNKSTAFSTRNTNIYSQRKIEVEPVFGFLNAFLEFTRMSLRGITNAKRKLGLALLAFTIRKITGLSANQFDNNRKIDNFYIFTVKIIDFILV